MGEDRLTYEFLLESVKTAVAVRSVSELLPAGGPNDKVFPPTYEGGKYALERRKIEGSVKDCVLLDSVASQANRIELALLAAARCKRLPLPVIEVDFSKEFPDVGAISTLEAPHRIADAILRDSLDGKTPFRETEAGKSFTDASHADATSLFAWCPTALILGMWDSTGPKGGLGAKFARCLVSEIVGVDVVVGAKTSSRIDPLQIQLGSGTLYEAADGSWTLNDKAALKENGKPKKLGKQGKPSEANHGNVTPSIDETAGGVTMSKALRFTTLSLAGLRRLHFPVKGDKATDERDARAWAALAAIGLCGSVLATEAGLDLRSRCLLVGTGVPSWEVIDGVGGVRRKFALDGNAAVALANEAIEEAKKAGLPYKAGVRTLRPKEDLVTLLRNSRDLASTGRLEEE
jgi:CRISPR-associated protein Csb1